MPEAVSEVCRVKGESFQDGKIHLGVHDSWKIENK